MPEHQDSQDTEETLGAQVGIATNLAGSALKHMQHMPNASSLAAVNRALDLLRSFLPAAERLRDQDRPALHARLTAILADATAARNTWAATIGVLAEADLKDMKRETGYRATSNAAQKKLLEDILKQEQNHAGENKKLL